ncbi:hypothetical protein [Piscinibacter gummiphilus]|uniref:Uncharacterized protein n=1 Tax=Piscinibacter gummiphilus TaxID=946333 RepID=A0ABZ0D3H3_9BURK|nr:hypothetical protein [Piscinibacter gummiphilus]WOB10046.1 hypothetical protein RXV79_08255 [Piscinibacter gummiphilus]
MPTLSPVKTALGQDELRHRTRGLGQRYRTVLLLVDGRRSLGDVLAMALKAGAQTTHFQELVEMGLVEVPTEMAAAEPVETEPGALDTPRLTSVDLDVFPEPALTPMAELLPDEEDSRPAPLSPTPPPAAPAQALVEPQLPRRVFEDPPTQENREVVLGSSQGLPMIDVGGIAAAPAEAPPAPAAAASRYVQAPAVVLNEAPRTPEWVQGVRETPFKTADHARPAPRMTEEERLQYVRDLLLDTLRRDSLLFATFSVGRVRAATTHKELIKLVWEIERDRAHPRRNRDQLLNLQRARELLGMGNTLVAGDSQPGAPSSEY